MDAIIFGKLVVLLLFSGNSHLFSKLIMVFCPWVYVSLLDLLENQMYEIVR